MPNRVKRFAALVLCLLTVFVAGPAYAVGEGVRPIAVWVEHDPWSMVIGSDSPSIAVYSDGTVLFQADRQFRSYRLGSGELEALKRQLGLEGDLSALSKYYQLTEATDQIHNLIYLETANGVVPIGIYGRLTHKNAEEVLPEGVKVIANALEGLKKPDAEVWLPEKIEVMVWPYEYAPEESIVWPEAWPGLDHPDTVDKGEDAASSIFVPSELYPEVVAFLKTRKPRGAVQFGKKKMAVSLRFPFPGEEQWMGGASTPE